MEPGTPPKRRKWAVRVPVRSGGPTLRDVAKRAGVSAMTVSNVVNKRFGSMSDETRQRVERAIEGLGYRPSGSARSLRLERNFTIGILVADPSAGFLADPFISQVVAGASGHFGERGYGCLVHGVRPQEFERSIFFKFARTDALCVFLSGTDAMRRSMMERVRLLPGPVIAVQEPNPCDLDDICIVRQDDEGGATALTERLVAEGASRIAFMAPRMTWPAINRRARGVRDVLSRAGGRLDIVRCGNGTIDEAKDALLHRLERLGLPSAIVAATDRVSIGAFAALKQADLGSVPLAGFRAVDFLRTSGPRLVAVSSALEIGRRSAELLIGRLETGRFAEREIVLPMRVEVAPSV